MLMLIHKLTLEMMNRLIQVPHLQYELYMGNQQYQGIIYFNALSPNAPCPISRRPGARTGPVSPTEKFGSYNDA